MTDKVQVCVMLISQRGFYEEVTKEEFEEFEYNAQGSFLRIGNSVVKTDRIESISIVNLGGLE